MHWGTLSETKNGLLQVKINWLQPQFPWKQIKQNSTKLFKNYCQSQILTRIIWILSVKQFKIDQGDVQVNFISAR